MTTSAIIARVRAAGGEIALVGDGIRLRAPASLRDEVISEIKAHRDAFKHVLKSEVGDANGPWDQEDYRAHYDEAAALAEYDYGLPRTQAEAYAFESTLVEWLNRSLKPSSPGRCAVCGSSGQADELVPFGTMRLGHVWLHSHCWSAWQARRRAEATVALAGFGIADPSPITAGEERSGR
jgi:hypothetical protein